MFVRRENGIIVESWTSAQTDEQRELGEAHPDWLADDHPDAIARTVLPTPPEIELTPEQKLAQAGLTVEELKALLKLP